MGLAGILSTGYAVKNIDKLSNISYHVNLGTIIGFQFNGISYRYFDAQDFLKGDYNMPIRFRQGKTDEEIFYVAAGFYEETKFLAYLSRQYDYAKLVIENKFDTSVLPNASIGVDTVKVIRVKSTAPYSQDFKYEEISWLYQGNPVYDRDLLKWIIPENASYRTQSYELSGTAGSYYANNIQQITTSSRIDPNDYGQAAGLLGAIALVIDQIVLEVFPVLDSASEFGDFIIAQKNYWRNELIHIDVSLTELNDYNTSLVALYENVYRSQNYLNNVDGKNKLLKLGAILSESALRIVPLSKRIEMLQLISRQSIEGEVITVITRGLDREALTIRIVNSVQPTEADLFLEALAKMEIISSNKNKTLFELLYSGIDNGHLLVGVNNLDRFMQAMYRVWLLSAYNPKDQLADDDIKEKDLNNVVCLNYKTDTALLFFNDTNYYFEFADNQILVKPDDSSALLEEQSLHMFRCMILMGTEHISGNQQIMEVNINGLQEMAIPLFYLKYIDDKKATDNLVTGIQIGVDIALTLAPIGNLSKLKHITRLTKFGRAIAGKTIVEGPGEVLLRLELAQGVVSAVEITAGLASIYYNYAKQVEEVCDVTSSQYDQEKCINYRRLADLFMYIGLVNGVLDVVAARKVKNVAKKILDSPIANTLDIDVYTILRKFAETLGDAIEATNTFWVYVRDPKNKELLTQGFIDLWENANIWTEALRTKFITDFSTEVVQLRYFQTEEMLTRWRQLATRDIPLSGNIRFLQDPVAANRMVELFDSPMLKSMYTVLLDTKTRTESLTAFLRKFDDLGATYYQKFADDTDLVKSWFRYIDEPLLNLAFLQLESEAMLKFVERYGKCSEEGFQMIKYNAEVHIARLLEYPDATHHLDYFNNRRAEMLPPGFKEADKGDFFNLHEIDTFIDVEIAYGGKSRASLKNEAGDIIMLGGNFNGQSLDPLGLAYSAIPSWNYRFTKELNSFKKSVSRHFGKISNPKGRPPLNKVVIDYKFMDEISVLIGENPNYLREEVDQYILLNFPQYNNSNFIIKINY
ncbi:hypothetical protein [Sphingobacterium detergens]